MHVVPDFGGNENVFADQRCCLENVFERVADFILVFVYGSAVDVSITALQSDFDGFTHFTRIRFPSTQA